MECSGTNGMPARRASGSTRFKLIEVVEAEEVLAEAEVRLQQARFDALLGIRYDADEFDKIIVAYRSAKRAADGARLGSSHPAASVLALLAQRQAFGQAADLAA